MGYIYLKWKIYTLTYLFAYFKKKYAYYNCFYNYTVFIFI